MLKGKFLHGKRNRRADHLIHVLVFNVVPYYHAKHLRQDWGFEGPNLELECREKMETAGKLIPINDIKELENNDGDDGMYSVQSQSNPNAVYILDFNDYSCDCSSFPSICFCKHLAAIQHHFFEILDIQPLQSLFALRIHPPQSIESSLSFPQLVPGSTHVQITEKAQIASLDDIASKLERLAARIRTLPSDHSASGLQALNCKLNDALHETPRRQLLPVPKRIAPNTGSEWKGPNGTQGRMGANVKGTIKRKHKDPYSGHQKPGIKGQAGESEPKKAKTEATRYANPIYS